MYYTINFYFYSLSCTDFDLGITITGWMIEQTAGWPKSFDTYVQAYSSENCCPFRNILGKHDATVNHSRIQEPKIQYVFISDHTLLNLQDMYSMTPIYRASWGKGIRPGKSRSTVYRGTFYTDLHTKLVFRG